MKHRQIKSAGKPKRGYYTESDRLHEALRSSQQEVLKMREQMEFLMFLVKRAWQGDENAKLDVAVIVGMENVKKEDLSVKPPQKVEENGEVEGERWATAVENMLERQREHDEKRASTVKLVQREVMLDHVLEQQDPVFSSYLNKPRGNFNQKVRPKSAVIPKSPQSIPPSRQSTRSTSRLGMSFTSPSGRIREPSTTTPASTPRQPVVKFGMRPLSAPLYKPEVSVHGSEITIAHNKKHGPTLDSEIRKRYYLQKRLGIKDNGIVLC